MKQEREREELPAHGGEVVRKDADGVEEAAHASSVGLGQAPAATSTQSVAKPSAIPSRIIQVTMIGIEKRRQTFASSSTTERIEPAASAKKVPCSAWLHQARPTRVPRKV